MDDKPTYLRSIDDEVDPLAWMERAKRANRQKRYDDKRAETRKEYDAKRGKRDGKSVMEKSRSGGCFVAVDAEGLNVGERFWIDESDKKNPVRRPVTDKDKSKTQYQDQRTCLWMAGGVQGIPNKIMQLSGHRLTNNKGFTSDEIMEYLVALPRHFYQAIKSYTGSRMLEEQPIFIAFGFGYDVGQIVKDLPFEKRWELNAGKPWSQRDNPNFIADLRAYPVLYKGFALYYIPGKMVTIFKLKDPAKPFSEGTHELNWRDRICIYDTFGFFQMKFTGALGGFPGALDEAEFKTVVENKAKRGKFTSEDMSELIKYTSLELKGLVGMLSSIRKSLLEAIPGKPIEISEWYGAGAIARASLKMYLGEDVRDHLGNMDDPTLWSDEDSYGMWVLRAYFGARIDLVKQGHHTGALYEYDIASAYPAIATDLPSMRYGKWKLVENPTWEDVFNASAFSMFEVKTYNYATDLPFYVLPYRTPSGSIMFPRDVHGYYMRDHVIAAYKHFDKFTELGRLADYSLNRGAPRMEILKAWIFYPGTQEKPLSWIREWFDYRTKLVKVNKKDARGQVIKLNINAVYGKFAQRIGRRGKPPKYGSLWFAAAITAGTQRRLIEAALTKPDSIVAFATDGIYTTEPLDVHVPTEKILGEWEMQKGEKGSFIQSGVYVVHLLDKQGKIEVKAKSRGFTPDNADKREGETYTDVLNRTLCEAIPQKWSNGEDDYSFPYQQYMTVGMSVQHRKFGELIGMWKLSPRELHLNSMSNKRIVPGELKRKAAKTVGDAAKFALTKAEIKLRESRARKLMPLQVWHTVGLIPLSEKSIPDWLDERTKLERQEVNDHENVTAGLS
jgi:hypothetical protein